MIDISMLWAQERSYFRLPFTPETRKLTQSTLDQYSEIRPPKRSHIPIVIRMQSFINEVLTISIVLDREEEEKVYIKVTTSELLVSCSVDTHEKHLSRYAYFTLYKLMYYYGEYDFEQYYWPDFFDAITEESKYLIILKSKNDLLVSNKIRYKGFFKPGQMLPTLTANILPPRKATPVIQEKPPVKSYTVLSFCLADLNNHRFRNNHYPFLVPYKGIIDKARNYIKSFKTFVVDETSLNEFDLTEEQQTITETCFEMRKIAGITNHGTAESAHIFEEKRIASRLALEKVFEIWQHLMPMIAGKLYCQYTYSFGMLNLKGKPQKSRMHPCNFSNEVPELCFLWKDIDDYYKLELRLFLDNKIRKVSTYYPTTFFVMTQEREAYYLLNSLMDWELISFFQQSHFQFLILKKHYDGYCMEFVEKLSTMYKFIKG